MELPGFLRASSAHGIEIKTIEMHTTGEPTRIVYGGYPNLSYAAPSFSISSPVLTLKVAHCSNSAQKLSRSTIISVEP